MDPPYEQGLYEITLMELAGSSLIKSNSIVCVEHPKRAELPTVCGSHIHDRRRQYGASAVTISQRCHKRYLTMSKLAIYPGSFDPVTNGHVNLIRRAVSIFDQLVVAVAINSKKAGCFSMEERIELLKAVTSDIPGVRVELFQGLLVDYAAQIGANVVVRGLRAMSDFEFEFQMAHMNRKLAPGVETVFLVTGADELYISSSVVREVASFGGDVTGLVPDIVKERLRAKFEPKVSG